MKIFFRLIILIGLFLSLSNAWAAKVPLLTPDELLTDAPAYSGTEVEVEGTLVPGSAQVQYYSEKSVGFESSAHRNFYFSFQIKGESQIINVVFPTKTKLSGGKRVKIYGKYNEQLEYHSQKLKNLIQAYTITSF